MQKHSYIFELGPVDTMEGFQKREFFYGAEGETFQMQEVSSTATESPPVVFEEGQTFHVYLRDTYDGQPMTFGPWTTICGPDNVEPVFELTNLRLKSVTPVPDDH